MRLLYIKQCLVITIVLILIPSIATIVINIIHNGSYVIARLEQLPLPNPDNQIQLYSQSSESNTSSGIKGVVSLEGTPVFSGSRPTSGRETIPNYKIEIFAEDGKTKIAQTTTDREGNFSISLPAGHYIIYTQGGPFNKISNDIVIPQGQIVYKELVVDMGVR
jgi:hypothetical protein